MNVFEAAKKVMINTYAQFPIELVKGEGVFVWDREGKRYLDFYGGHAVCLIGHSPPSVVKAIAKQASALLFYSNIFSTLPAAALAERLTSTIQETSYKVYFANSGSEANETALKMARKHTGKLHVVSFKNSFHGRGSMSLAVTGIDSYHKYDPNFDEYTVFADFGDLDSVRRAITEDTAAVICEPIQSIGGVKTAKPAFYQKLAELCGPKGILLIFDEVQTGLGRTGTFWFSQGVEVAPDIITTAKGIASGLPLSCVLVKDCIADKIKIGDHATTFGGGPVVCAAALATLDVITVPGFLDDVMNKSTYFMQKLATLPGVKRVLGKGFLIGLETGIECKSLVEKCLEKGLIIGSSSEKNVVRLMPPLTVSLTEIDDCISLLQSIL